MECVVRRVRRGDGPRVGVEGQRQVVGSTGSQEGWGWGRHQSKHLEGLPSEEGTWLERFVQV